MGQQRVQVSLLLADVVRSFLCRLTVKRRKQRRPIGRLSGPSVVAATNRVGWYLNLGILSWVFACYLHVV